jgi:lysophospholipid acyltransferase (LPLAT)-like uncharacterized protein
VYWLARQWGRIIGAYGALVVRRKRAVLEGAQHAPDGPCIWVSWHSTYLVALAFHPQHRQRRCEALIPPGREGAMLGGWLERAGITPLAPLADEASSAHGALRQLAHSLKAGHDVVMTLDGPHGPAGQARPGALWLAQLSGRPLAPAGLAAWPALHTPGWDRHLIPLPGCRLAIVFGAPIYVAPGIAIDEALAATGGARLDALNQRAWELIASSW